MSNISKFYNLINLGKTDKWKEWLSYLFSFYEIGTYAIQSDCQFCRNLQALKHSFKPRDFDGSCSLPNRV